MQNIPSHNKDIRKMFIAKKLDKTLDVDTTFTVDRYSEVETPIGWVLVNELNCGDKLLLDNKPMTITSIKKLDDITVEIIVDKGVVE